MVRFCRFDLRTTDADAARGFYAMLLGHDRSSIWPLHEQALARGARPHWLGRLGVENVEQTAAAFERLGATRFGSVGPQPDGGQAAVLRDPGGALLALGTAVSAPVDVVWHILNTADVSRATANYRELFGWSLGDRFDLGAQGSFQQFAWQAGEPAVGALGDIAGRPGVHPQWLFFFEVDALDVALAFVREAGGVTLEPMVSPSGARVCVCDDPQGAAFALRERR